MTLQRIVPWIAAALYAIVAFIGLRVSIADFFTHAKAWMSVPVNPQPKTKKVAAAATTTVVSSAGSDWASVLHFGSGDWSTGTRPVAAAGLLSYGGQPRLAQPTPHKMPAMLIKVRGPMRSIS